MEGPVVLWVPYFRLNPIERLSVDGNGPSTELIARLPLVMPTRPDVRITHPLLCSASHTSSP
jgi:hypothetical protein